MDGCRARRFCWQGETLLHVATLGEQVAMVQTLVMGGADAHARTAAGSTALHLAAITTKEMLQVSRSCSRDSIRAVRLSWKLILVVVKGIGYLFKTL